MVIGWVMYVFIFLIWLFFPGKLHFGKSIWNQQFVDTLFMMVLAEVPDAALDNLQPA